MNPKLTPEARRQYRDRLAASRAFAKELAEHERGIAAMTTTKLSFDPLDGELEDCFREDGNEVEARVEHWGLPRTRSSALHYGTAQYSTGRRCCQDHDSPRWTASGRCAMCQLEGDQERAEIEARLAAEALPGSRSQPLAFRRHRKPVVATKQSG